MDSAATTSASFLMGRTDSRSNTLWWIALGAVAALTAAGFYTMLSVRFSNGESYPRYSTLRADPLGARAIFEALSRQPHVECVRNFERLEKLNGSAGETLVLLNVSGNAFNRVSHDFYGKTITQWAVSGGRVVITLNPKVALSRIERAAEEASREVEEEEEKESKKQTEKKKQKNAPQKKEEENPTRASRSKEASSLAEALKIGVQQREFVLTDKGGAVLSTKQGAPVNAEDLPRWFSNLFLNDDPKQKWNEIKDGSKEKTEADTDSTDVIKPPSPWRAIAQRGDRPMIMERRMGAGSIVICTDSFFASNEALWSDPKTVFLSWLIGDARRVIFDETHLGSNIGDEDSLMTLARRYRMHGLFIGALLLFALYVWRNSMSLVPANDARDLGHWRNDAVAGQSAASGLECLLFRGITRKQILSRCFETWDRTPSAANAVPTQRRAKARAELDSTNDLEQVPALYRRLRDIIHPPRR